MHNGCYCIILLSVGVLPPQEYDIDVVSGCLDWDYNIRKQQVTMALVVEHAFREHSGVSWCLVDSLGSFRMTLRARLCIHSNCCCRVIVREDDYVGEMYMNLGSLKMVYRTLYPGTQVCALYMFI